MKHNKFFSLLIIIICFSVITSITSPALCIGDVDWILLKENKDGKEWLDLGSLKRINKNEVSVLTRFTEKSNKDNEEGKTNLYVMRINCVNKQFKDTSTNGLPNLFSKWQNSNNDELIDVVIQKSCNVEAQ